MLEIEFTEQNNIFSYLENLITYKVKNEVFLKAELLKTPHFFTAFFMFILH